MPDYRTHVLTDNLPRLVIRLAAPVAAGMLAEILIQGVNLFWVGRLGAPAQDALASSMVILWTVMASLTVVTFGLAAPLSQAIGAGERDHASRVLSNAMLLALGIGLVEGITIYCLIDPLIHVLRVDPSTAVFARAYLRVHALAMPVYAVLETGNAGLRAAGNARFPSIVAIGMVIGNALLDPLLIFGLGRVPAMGTGGAALATAIAHTVAMIIVVRHLAKPNAAVHLAPHLRSLRLRIQAEILRLGFPIMSQWLTFTAIYWFLIGIVHGFGPQAGAALGIGNRLESLSYMMCTALAMAASTTVGQNLGAGQPERARRGAWLAVGTGMLLTGGVALLFVLFPEMIVAPFTSDTTVRQMAARYVMILGFSQITMSLEIILEGAFSGAGNTLPPMLVMLPGAVARIPLAIWLSDPSRLGLDGVWWSLTITTTIKGLALAVWFSQNRWQKAYRVSSLSS